MKDIFDAKIMCKNCNMEMAPVLIDKKGFKLRALHCGKCNDRLVHPVDQHNFDLYSGLKGKTYDVKLRVVGNSHTVSIPKEIVEFINDVGTKMNKHMNDVVRLCFEDFNKLSLRFFEDGDTKW